MPIDGEEDKSDESEGEDVLDYICKFPVKLSNRFIGKKGQNIQWIMKKTGVSIRLKPDPDSSLFELCSIRGREKQINYALTMINSDTRFADVDLSSINVTTHIAHSSRAYIGNLHPMPEKEQEDSPMKSGLLSSIDAVFEQNKKEDEKRKQTLKTKREAELEHSRYLKNASSPQDLSEAKFVVDQWANKHCSRKMKAVSKEVADRRSHTNKPYSRPTEGSQSNISKMNSRFGTSLYSSVQNQDSGNIIRTQNNDKAGQSSASATTDEHSSPSFSNFSTSKNIRSETPSKSRNYSLIELSSDEDSIINISDTCPHDNSDFISLHNRDGDDVVIQITGSSEKKKLSKDVKSSVEQENQEDGRLVKCPVMNCNCKFRLKTEFQSHMDKFEHSPNNPWYDYVSGQEENAVMCPECCKVFENSEVCLQHMKDRNYNHPLPPLPVAGYLCGHCLSVFPNQKSCTLHITERKHIQQVFQFSDDTGKNYYKGVPISTNFFQDYYKRCMTSEFHIKCCDCELPIESPRELQQHYNETKLMHHCMALTDVQKSDIFESYLCTNVCVTCHAVIIDPNQNAGYHNCSASLVGKVIVDGCKSFSSLILGQCIRLEQEKIGKVKDMITSTVVTSEPMEVNPYPTKCLNLETDDKPGPSNRQRYFSGPSTISNMVAEEGEVFPGPSYLKTMVNIIFLDLDNWGGFFKKIPNRLPPKTFVWGFYGGKTNWTEPFKCGPFEYQKREKRFHLNEQCGTTKDAADFAICLTVGKMDMCLPSTVHFTILSGDKGFCEIERQMKSSKRKAVVIDPHRAMKMSNQVLYTMIVSVGDN